MKEEGSAPIIIIGAHRSGTTATARALELIGLQIGEHLDSHREPRALQKLHEDYLQRVGAAWHNPWPFRKWIESAEGMQDCVSYLRRAVEQNFARTFCYRRNPKALWLRLRLYLGKPWGWKEPRTTLFAPAWSQVFPNARFLHVIRDSLAAAESIRERELKFQAAGDAPTPNLSEVAYCKQLADAYLEAAKEIAMSTKYYSFQFEELQANPPAMLEQLAKFCGLRPERRQMPGPALRG